MHYLYVCFEIKKMDTEEYYLYNLRLRADSSGVDTLKKGCCLKKVKNVKREN